MTPRTHLFIDLQPSTASLREDVLRGLSGTPKALPPKYFYDAAGSALFERICALPEYYPTRTEMQIMRDHATDMARALGRGCALLEYGSGSGLKTRVLLEALRPVAYLPIDISRDALEASAAAVAQDFPDIEVIAVCADYSAPVDIELLGRFPRARRVVYFSGSTIGNFTPEDARTFLRRASALVGEGGAMLVGVDLRKSPDILHAAYNDAQGVTARFNLNLLARLNRELDADFDLAAWDHRAFYDADSGRIEMHLVSLAQQTVEVAGRRFAFERGETIHTENSYKYSIEDFRALASEAGFTPAHWWTDAACRFSVHYLVAG